MKESFFQYKMPRLTSLNFNFNEEFNYKSVKGDILTQCKTFIRKIDDNCSVVALQFLVGEKTNECPFFLDITMEALFNWTDADPSLIERLLTQNAPSLLLSYIRPVVADVTSRAGFRFDIPFMNFIDNKAEK